MKLVSSAKFIALFYKLHFYDILNTSDQNRGQRFSPIQLTLSLFLKNNYILITLLLKILFYQGFMIY